MLRATVFSLSGLTPTVSVIHWSLIPFCYIVIIVYGSDTLGQADLISANFFLIYFRLSETLIERRGDPSRYAIQ